MPDADPTRPLRGPIWAGGDLGRRTVSALLLAPLAVGIAYVGGGAFVAFWGGAAILIFWEWVRLVEGSNRRPVLMAGGASVALAVILAGAMGNSVEGVHKVRLFAALTLLAMGMLGTAGLARRKHRIWVAGGVLYAGTAALAPIVLRSDAQRGFLAIVVLFTVVWVTDILAYFIGRIVGGPKLAPSISPNKTWSGAIGGAAAAVAVVTGIGLALDLAGVGMIALVAAALSIVGQAGDLFESALKRRFGAKDSSHLIPGHGGLMDRLDAFIAAAAFAAMIGVSRGGLEAPGRGLLLW